MVVLKSVVLLAGYPWVTCYSKKKHALLRSTPEYSKKKNALLRSTPEYSGVLQKKYSGVLRSCSGAAPEQCHNIYSRVILRSNVATMFMCLSDGGELGGEGRRGSSASVLFLFIKLLHQEMDAKKRILVDMFTP